MGDSYQEKTYTELIQEVKRLEKGLFIALKAIEDLKEMNKHEKHYREVAEAEIKEYIKFIRLAMDLLKRGDENSATEALIILSLSPVYERGEGLH